MQDHFGRLHTDVMPIFMITTLDIVITLRFSINSSVVICSPTKIIPFLREASSETYGPWVSFHHIRLYDLFSFAFIFRSIKTKIQKYLAAIYSYLFYLAFDLSIYYNLFTSICQFLVLLPERD